jgi:small subunit ribosomal protein S8
MSLQDTLSDLLTRIRNAQRAGKKTVVSPSSNMRQEFLKVLETEWYILGSKIFYDESDVDQKKPNVNIRLKYYEGRPVIQKITRVSSPGLRIYRTQENLPKVLGYLGIAVISTSRGLMTDKQARSLGLGGEVLATVE